jgi:hypothetical protein
LAIADSGAWCSSPALQSAQRAKEPFEVGVGDLGERAHAAPRLVVTCGRVLDAEQIMKEIPDVIVGAMARLPLPDVENDDDRAVVIVGHKWRLCREGKAVTALEVDAAHDGLQWPAESVGAQGCVTRIGAEVSAYLAVAEPLARKLVDLGLDGRRDEDVDASGRACAELSRRDRT